MGSGQVHNGGFTRVERGHSSHFKANASLTMTLENPMVFFGGKNVFWLS